MLFLVINVCIAYCFERNVGVVVIVSPNAKEEHWEIVHRTSGESTKQG